MDPNPYSNDYYPSFADYYDQYEESNEESFYEEELQPPVSAAPDPTGANQYPPRPPTVEKKRRVTSEVWQHFTRMAKMVDGQRKWVAICKYCNKDLSGESSQGTGHLKRHWQKTCRAILANLRGQQQINFTPRYATSTAGNTSGAASNDPETETGDISTFTYDQREMRKNLTRYVVASDQPFTFADDVVLEWFMRNNVQLAFRRVPRTTLRNDTISEYEELKKLVINEIENFSGVISLTSDLWTSNQDLGYICATGHYIDSEWKLSKKILAFRVLEYPHTGSTIYEALKEILIEYKYNKPDNKIFSITLDNAKPNNHCVKLLKTFLKLPYEGQLFHIRCMCHIINLIAQDGLNFATASISVIKKAVLFTTSSPSRLQMYYQLCNEMGLKKRKLKNDVKTRWNSTYIMLKSCKGYEHAITTFFNAKQDELKLSQEHWNLGFVLMNVLEPLYIATNQLSGIYYPTSCLALYFICSEYIFDPLFGDIVRNMELKFKKYWEKPPILFALAAIMDPRYKLEGVIAMLETISNNLNSQLGLDANDVTKLFYEMYDNYFTKCGNTSTSQPVSSSSVGRKDRTWLAISSRSRGKQKVGSTSSGGISEFTNYTNMDYVSEIELQKEQFDILMWWKAHETTYPVLSAMARDLLTPPASTVASESAFSAGGRVLDDRRSRLSPQLVECIMCMKDWTLANFRVQNRLAEDILEDLDNLDLEN